MPEVVIIGGGVVGASVAYHLTERGCLDVLMLDREEMLGLGSTGKATGGVRAQFETDINIKLSLYSMDFFRDWDFDCEYDPKGYLFLATNNLHLEYLDRTGERQRELGYDGVHLLTQAEVAAMVPGVNCDDIVGGSFGPRDGFINPLAILEGFMVEASMSGAKVKTGTLVRAINVENGRVTGLHTSDGTLECDRVVLCSGAWARHLAATAGIDLPVEPQRRQIVWAKAAKALPPDLPMVIDLKDGFHFRPARDFHVAADTGDGRDVLFAYADPDEPPGFSTEFDDAFLDKVGEKAAHRAPFLNGAQIVYEKCRAGLYENSPDHHAILGGCEVEGLYFANGFSGHGVMHSPATGRALAEIILDGESSFLDVSSLHIDRFANGELLHETAFI
ncbi:MAG TPA: FAD-binding oxidoreductase [Pyrinomonadaceae bacterium]|nr:FAD-binding oxidoreductase [Pyrinomonadaceae bacterium]